MSETKDDIAADRDRLAAENTALRAQLAATGTAARTVQGPAQLFLTEGDRQELEMFGVATIGGRLLSREEVLEQLAGGDQAGTVIAEPAPALDRRPTMVTSQVSGPGIRGIDYVYPSVERGLIDPAVAGTPGINGPSA